MGPSLLVILSYVRNNASDGAVGPGVMTAAGFAGNDVEQAVFYPEDARFLVDRETTMAHYEVIEPAPVTE
ncbi:MAG TPA: hypothetical protein VHA53_06575 [Nitrolancea sp.]|nr:hypothetical protein [Nitrolancea sp.]